MVTPAHVSALRSLAQARTGMVAGAPGRTWSAPRPARYLVPLLLLAALAACDVAAPTAPEATGSAAPDARGREAAAAR